MIIDPFGGKPFDAVRRLLQEQAAVEAAYVLGSAVTGQLRPDSDIDIAILPRPAAALTVVDRMGLSAQLGKLLGRTVDLGVLTHANLVYAKEAVARGRLIFERDHAATARFEMLTLSMYAALQEARREVLRAYAA
jgi:predicted nucleotidyltransferase